MLLENCFLSSVPGSQVRMPGYNAFYEADDGRISTRYHRKLLQFCSGSEGAPATPSTASRGS